MVWNVYLLPLFSLLTQRAFGAIIFNGGVMITAMRDSLVTVLVDGVAANLGAAGTVQGNPDFVTYRNLTLFNQNTKVNKISIVAQGAVQVAMYGQNNVFAPNMMNPDSKNGNQAFTIFSRDNLPIHRLAIFDRWGERIFEARDIKTNVLEQGWNGTFRGQRVATGVYVFYAELEVLPGKTVILKGDVTVLYWGGAVS